MAALEQQLLEDEILLQGPIPVPKGYPAVPPPDPESELIIGPYDFEFTYDVIFKTQKWSSTETTPKDLWEAVKIDFSFKIRVVHCEEGFKVSTYNSDHAAIIAEEIPRLMKEKLDC